MHLRTDRIRHLRHTRLGVGDQTAHRRAAQPAARSSKRVGAQPLGPAMQRRVRWRPVAELTPSDLPQAPVASRILRDVMLDRRQPVGLARQRVARQHTGPRPALQAPRDRHRRGQGNHLQLAALVRLEQDEATRHR